MPVNFLVDRRGASLETRPSGTTISLLRGQELIRDSCPLLYSHFLLKETRQLISWMGKYNTNQKLEMAVLVFDHRGTGVAMGSGNDESSQFVEVCWSHRLRESEFTSEDGGDADFVRLDIHVGGNNRTSGVVDAFPLWQTENVSQNESFQITRTVIPSCACGKVPPSFRATASRRLAEVFLV